jgi:DNA-binding LytR/AlgR family response regulator
MILKASYKNGDGHVLYNIHPDEVVYVEQNGDYHFVHLSDKRVKPISFHGNSAFIAERFPNLVKAHKSYHINPEHVFSIAYKDGSHVSVSFKNGIGIVFSKSKLFHLDFLKSFIDASDK